MKLKLFSIPCILLLAITLIIASCTKEGPAGSTGPAGPQGSPGGSGAAGATGTTGAAGTAGTANVIYSDWLNVTYQGADSTGWFAEIAAPKLVDSILNRGAIKVYFNAGSDSTNGQVVMTLPVYEPFLLGVIINPYFTNQKITLISSGNVSSFTRRAYRHFQYRYVLIPGGIKAGRGINTVNTINTINWNDYKQVKEYLGLKD